MNKKEMKEALENMAADYEETRTGLYIITRDRLFLEESLKRLESNIAYEVSTETDNGKKVYSNDTIRVAETHRRLEAIASYRELKQAVDTLTNEEMRKKADLSVLDFKLRAMECIVKLEVG